MSHTGTVHIVGAGPGNPEYITVRGLICLREADVVLHDRLIGVRLLEETKIGAEIIDVGKKPGAEDQQQEQIHSIMIDRAKRGKSVCRLKGGDSFVFGRGGEEVEVLSAAGIPFEIVPGVSSAIAVPECAGIPITHREHAHSFMVIAGSRSHPLNSPQWEAARALVKAGGTLIVLMGVSRFGEIMESLRSECSNSTPVAVISNGTTPRQTCCAGTIADIAERMDSIESPGIAVVGQVVSLRSEMQWLAFANRFDVDLA